MRSVTNFQNVMRHYKIASNNEKKLFNLTLQFNHFVRKVEFTLTVKV